MPTKNETILLKFNDSANQWSMKLGSGGWQLPPNYPVLQVGDNQVGLFTFEIDPSTNVTFASAPFTQKTGGSPKADFSDQFLVFPLGPKKLIVVDTNENKGGGPYHGGNYDYQLNFVGKKPLDPIISNNGCCKLFSEKEIISYSLDALSVLLLAVLVVKLVIKPWLDGRKAANPAAGK